MLFSSVVFLFYFFPVVFCVYYLLSFSRQLQNVWLLLASLFFYAWGEPINVLLMVFSIILNWAMGFIISKEKVKKSSGSKSHEKAYMIFATVVNLGILFLFKYLNFIIRNIYESVEGEVLFQLQIVLPVGISFFTFQALSYVFDVYYEKTVAEKNPFFVGLYIAFFPQLIAGPIVRYNSIAKQILKRKSSFENISQGAARFTVGMCKKVLLANNFAIVVDTIFAYASYGRDVYNVPVLLAWIGAIAYTLQIYFDFSGYSDMAIGLGLMFGFKFDENFNYPYVAVSMKEFWQRWHISLTTWFREYLYIPLGGNRVKNQDHVIRNLFIVWFITGIWHGAEWTFVFWGLWHFSFQIAERFFGYAKDNKHKFLMWIYTMFVVVIGWTMFRAENLYLAGQYFKYMFGLNNNTFSNRLVAFLLKDYGIYFILGIVFSTPIANNINLMIKNQQIGKIAVVINILYPVVILFGAVICVTYLVSGGYNPFIYFNF
ncbi:MAG: MBOAT family O-acyltransferase [Lachnospiraceae bacterium]